MRAERGGNPRNGRPPGVREVARRAGVSLGTVSNVLNNRDRVRPETRRRVEAAISELEFVGSPFARQFRLDRSQTIGVLLPDPGNPFWAAVLRGIEDAVEARQLALFVSSSRQDLARERRAMRAFQRQRVDGLITAPLTAGAPELLNFQDRPLGVVTVDRRLRGAGISSVTLDDAHGGHLIASHLLALGHRRVVMVNGPRRISWCSARHRGVLAAIKEARLPLEEAFTELAVAELTVADGINVVPQLLERAGRATAIVCVNDLLALGVLTGLRQRGLDVPRDFSLVGFDDVDFAVALAPALTTIRQPGYDMGMAAANLLLQHAAAGSSHVTFEPELVVRASSAPIR